ncbi:SGNH/GDSL hydrolase family protein [Francisella frigiditurris]|uniref:GDSL-like Lipase/Acylhydrolase family protein n=1 Tax=Francisella frigiditurris TaxID=1542390 RepID=A0A1J0KVM4_9GAMM|nr:SGNH/GDSL hydrolase family protein [Francisella frigiditurris]APC97872.1 GDSL-like Lipase/Acylhydrolase family protein [Francisella frigiditurris]
MLKQIKLILALVLVCCCYSGSYAFGEPNYSTIVAFGDSLTDNGNVYKKSLETIPNEDTWYKGRFSNSRTWAEYLCSYSSDKDCKFLDYAYGGAYSSDGYQNVKVNDEVIYKLTTNFLQQIDNFVKKDKKYDPDKTLYVMSIGGNDIMERKKKYVDVPENVDKAIDTLIKEKNAKHIIYLNIPDISRAPMFNQADKEKKQKIHEKVVKLNKQLEKVIEKYSDQGIDIKLVDFYTFLNNLIDDKSYISDKPCIDIPLSADKLNFVLEYDKTSDCKKNLTKYVFFDNLHPTGNVHKILSEEVKKDM